MRAIVQHRYGGPEQLALAEVEAPAPAAGEVLIRVAAVAISMGDVLLMRGEPRAVRLAFGLRRPKRPIIGRDVAGEVVAVGDAVTRFAIGDAVFAESDQGGFAEFVAVPERFVAVRPTSVDAVHAAAVVVSGTTALQGLRLAGVGPGQHLLVNGASGGVGGYAVQLAKGRGAEVTGVCRGAKAEHVRAIGADHADIRGDDATRLHIDSGCLEIEDGECCGPAECVHAITLWPSTDTSGIPAQRAPGSLRAAQHSRRGPA